VLKTAALKSPAIGDDEALFQEAARNYRALAAKPQLPEAAHRFAVQAEGAVRDKDFDGAARFYMLALGIAPWWPEGHFNRALVLSEIEDFSEAIFEMKRYLTLVPNAPNARAAQDKIYDWERKQGFEWERKAPTTD
jgi:tetratricopeptide (TPR) repeat protein